MRVQVLIGASFALLAISIGIFLRPDAFHGAEPVSLVLFVTAILGWNEAIKRAKEYDEAMAARDKQIIDTLKDISRKLDGNH